MLRVGHTLMKLISSLLDFDPLALDQVSFVPPILGSILFRSDLLQEPYSTDQKNKLQGLPFSCTCITNKNPKPPALTDPLRSFITHHLRLVSFQLEQDDQE